MKKVLVNKKNLFLINIFISSIYVALSLIFHPISFSFLQFRISEMLIVFVDFDKSFVLSMTFGCFLSNLFSGNIIDIIFGTFATFISSLLITKIKTLNFFVKFSPNVIVNALLMPLIFIFGYGLNSNLFFVMFASIFISQSIVTYILGYALHKFINKYLGFKYDK